MNQAALARLAHKYEVLAALRRARARGEPIPEREVFRDLAREFPGCLRELDTLAIEVIDARAAALSAAANGGPIAPWMAPLADYHALLRAALRIKRKLAKINTVDDDRAEALARDAALHAQIAVDPAFVRAVADPPRGRLVAVVLARLAAEHGEGAEALSRALFPRAR